MGQTLRTDAEENSARLEIQSITNQIPALKHEMYITSAFHSTTKYFIMLV